MDGKGFTVAVRPLWPDILSGSPNKWLAITDGGDDEHLPQSNTTGECIVQLAATAVSHKKFADGYPQA